MSFRQYKAVISEGDTVILYININSMYAIEVESYRKNKNDQLVENIFQTTYGALKVTSLVGKKYGTKVQLSRGWAYVLHPTPELWTLTLPHRTQIIYSLDSSVIVHELELRPGHVVIESGTGSGSLSHSLIRTIQPSGHLYTFDFHSERVLVAKKEFENHDIGEFVTVQQRDVCKDGFGDDLVGRADAVFLDLPHPWEALTHVPKVFKDTGGRFCSFSPCIEQVQKTCEALKALGFAETRTIECLQREYQVQYRNFPVLDLEGRSGVSDSSYFCGARMFVCSRNWGYVWETTESTRRCVRLP
ncbi:UNVERIFIED_CONTAM: hypothetical protein PYX00_003925 [Menopon gallinae]|uniref:tRNA (adenine(58)-N(1))-methyltransferase catalytic subunit TRMT61A n=1 Tax=Menopon gallinae TaxID=328185 RepID=A0AAW2I1W2_9NEOP